MNTKIITGDDLPPNRLWKMLTISLDDMEFLRNAPKIDDVYPQFIPTHAFWIRSSPPNCHVCLAGAVMVGTLEYEWDDPEGGVDYWDLPVGTWGRELGSLDRVLNGELDNALLVYHQKERVEQLEEEGIPEWIANRRGVEKPLPGVQSRVLNFTNWGEYDINKEYLIRLRDWLKQEDL